jgi:hypothetical protein
MVPWMIALAGYFAAGLTFVFAGPAARLRRCELENLEWQAHHQARWKLIAFSSGLALGIIIIWPVLVVSAARTEAGSKSQSGLRDPHPVEPSATLDRWVSEVQTRYSSSLPLEDYQKIWRSCLGPIASISIVGSPAGLRGDRFCHRSR